MILDIVSTDGREGIWYEFFDVAVSSAVPLGGRLVGEPIEEVTLNFGSVLVHMGFCVAVAAQPAASATGATSGKTMHAKSMLRAVKKK